MNHPVLTGQHITLTPITDEHFDALQTIVLADPDVYRYTTIGVSAPAFARWFTKAQADSAWTVIRQSDQRPVGSTRLYNIDSHVASASVGYTWYAPDCRATGINDESKLLLLTHAFDTMALNRLVFEINADNLASRKAVEKLGAQLEGVLQQNRRTTAGQLANTCIYALLATDWGETKNCLQQKVK